MGLFYTNLSLFGVNQNHAAEYLSIERDAYVSPTVNNFTVVYDKVMEDQDTNTIKKFSSSLSKALSCKAIAVLVHDGDLFLYWLYDSGNLVDHHNSIPSYLDDTKIPLPPSGGNIRKLCAAFNANDVAKQQVQGIFQIARNSATDADVSDYLSGENIHRELARALNIPMFAVETGYYTIANGLLSDEFDIEDFIKCSTS